MSCTLVIPSKYYLKNNIYIVSHNTIKKLNKKYNNIYTQYYLDVNNNLRKYYKMDIY